MSASALDLLRESAHRIRPSAGLGVQVRQMASGTILSVPGRQRRSKAQQAPPAPLTLTTRAPAWWTPPVPDTAPLVRLWVAWGTVNNRVPEDGPHGGIFTPLEITNPVRTTVWVKVTFNEAFNDVAHARIEAGGDADVPQWNEDADSATVTTTFYYVLGQVIFSGTPLAASIVNTGSGSLGCGLYQTYQGGCVLPDGTGLPVSRIRLAPAFWRL